MEYLPTGMNDFVAMYLGSPVPIYIMVAIAAYFLGCFNGAVIVSKYILRNDIRNHGSGNAGLTNFHRVFGGGLTFVVILCDVLKAVLAVLIGSGLFGLCLENAVLGKYWAGLFCLLGHMFPCMFGHCHYDRLARRPGGVGRVSNPRCADPLGLTGVLLGGSLLPLCHLVCLP